MELARSGTPMIRPIMTATYPWTQRGNGDFVTVAH